MEVTAKGFNLSPANQEFIAAKAEKLKNRQVTVQSLHIESKDDQFTTQIVAKPISGAAFNVRKSNQHFMASVTDAIHTCLSKADERKHRTIGR
ncbi:HPF/RaiA family ribosome-associated protein [Ferrimonas marina]|uniref:Sigma 54 modulation protein / S30EA ribosomal protein n=1 Tax=Ferrimonas marina TaxID=299255 RepID=A0A1M5TDM9_9GAMM|nr:HPF/RaiA family ribosome-associated protein [Ferrimonas marina]SHH48443.1 Sigma 54 modulation protein / S30EA ribosomal protein [Ferrimonas marina]